MHEFLGSDFIIAAQLSLSLWIFHTVFEALALLVTYKNKETLALILSSEDVPTNL